MIPKKDDYKKAEEVLRSGGICVLPTDTVYGIHCLALSQESVNKVYEIKARDRTKPFIILIPDIKSLKSFGINYDTKFLKKYWPGPYSIIFPCNLEEFKYLHCGKNSLAFRIPNKKNLIKLLKGAGPLISTSVNIEGEEQIESVPKAKEKFGKLIDYYLNEGILDNKPSKVIDLNNKVYRA